MGDPGQPRLGVPIGRGRVAVDGAEIALPVDERIAKGELLDHTHERFVDRRIAMRVVLAEHFADDLGRLAIRAVPGQPQLGHRVEHAAVHGLEAVADIRQRPPDDDGHGVVQVRLPHLFFDRDGGLALGGHGGGRSS